MGKKVTRRRKLVPPTPVDTAPIKKYNNDINQKLKRQLYTLNDPDIFYFNECKLKNVNIGGWNPVRKKIPPLSQMISERRDDEDTKNKSAAPEEIKTPSISNGKKSMKKESKNKRSKSNKSNVDSDRFTSITNFINKGWNFALGGINDLSTASKSEKDPCATSRKPNKKKRLSIKTQQRHYRDQGSTFENNDSVSVGSIPTTKESIFDNRRSQRRGSGRSCEMSIDSSSHYRQSLFAKNSHHSWGYDSMGSGVSYETPIDSSSHNKNSQENGFRRSGKRIRQRSSFCSTMSNSSMSPAQMGRNRVVLPVGRNQKGLIPHSWQDSLNNSLPSTDSSLNYSSLPEKTKESCFNTSTDVNYNNNIIPALQSEHISKKEPFKSLYKSSKEINSSPEKEETSSISSMDYLAHLAMPPLHRQTTGKTSNVGISESDDSSTNNSSSGRSEYNDFDNSFPSIHQPMNDNLVSPRRSLLGKLPQDSSLSSLINDTYKDDSSRNDNSVSGSSDYLPSPSNKVIANKQPSTRQQRIPIGSYHDDDISMTSSVASGRVIRQRKSSIGSIDDDMSSNSSVADLLYNRIRVLHQRQADSKEVSGISRTNGQRLRTESLNEWTEPIKSAPNNDDNNSTALTSQKEVSLLGMKKSIKSLLSDDSTSTIETNSKLDNKSKNTITPAAPTTQEQNNYQQGKQLNQRLMQLGKQSSSRSLYSNESSFNSFMNKTDKSNNSPTRSLNSINRRSSIASLRDGLAQSMQNGGKQNLTTVRPSKATIRRCSTARINRPRRNSDLSEDDFSLTSFHTGKVSHSSVISEISEENSYFVQSNDASNQNGSKARRLSVHHLSHSITAASDIQFQTSYHSSSSMEEKPQEPRNRRKKLSTQHKRSAAAASTIQFQTGYNSSSGDDDEKVQEEKTNTTRSKFRTQSFGYTRNNDDESVNSFRSKGSVSSGTSHASSHKYEQIYKEAISTAPAVSPVSRPLEQTNQKMNVPTGGSNNNVTLNLGFKRLPAEDSSVDSRSNASQPTIMSRTLAGSTNPSYSSRRSLQPKNHAYQNSSDTAIEVPRPFQAGTLALTETVKRLSNRSVQGRQAASTIPGSGVQSSVEQQGNVTTSDNFDGRWSQKVTLASAGDQCGITNGFTDANKDPYYQTQSISDNSADRNVSTKSKRGRSPLFDSSDADEMVGRSSTSRNSLRQESEYQHSRNSHSSGSFEFPTRLRSPVA